jgi:hypothetical protein
MATVTRQQLAQQLNTLSAQGATENQITNAIAAAGYQDSDFNIDLSGKFTPLTIGQGKVAGQDYTKPSAAEQADSDSFYNNLAAESSSTKPGSTSTNTFTKTETFAQSTGGGSTTVYSTPSIPTATSKSYESQANQAYVLAESYRLNPDSKFGKSALDKRLADGRITQDQYNEIVNSSADQRRNKSLEYSNQYEQARTNQINSEVGGTPTVVVQPSQTNSQVSVMYENTLSSSTTALDGAVGGTNITSTTVDGTEYQVTPTGDGNATYTPVGAPNENAAKATTFTVVTPQITTTNLVVPTDQNDTTGLDAGDQIPGVPVVKTTITTNDFGEELVLTQPIEVVEPQKTGDTFPNEFEGVDEAVALQEKIAINTSGLPVRAEDGTVAEGVLTNPETGETYYPGPTGSAKGLSGARDNGRSQSTAQNQANFNIKEDWRVRLSLAPNATYLYKANPPGILQPLQDTKGVIFPYTPSIQIQYSAHYDNYDLTHSNYKIHQYKNSSVDSITLSCDFTAQDTSEANYLLAVIHFFRSVTKMFYGQDSIPKIGTPPPLCFLSGLGSFQFDTHPLVITNFSYNLPTDVDYIRSSSTVTTIAGVSKAEAQVPNNTNAVSASRLSTSSSPAGPGGVTPEPVFGQQTTTQTPSASSRTPTYVPTKMNIAITAVPIVTRNDISNRFSLKDYATGKLLQGKENSTVGIW